MCACDRGVLLTNSDVDTEQVFTLLVNDRIDSDSGFACLAVADDQFTLSTSDRNHAINSLEAGLYGSIYALARDDARSDTLDWAELVGDNRAAFIERLAQWIDHSTKKCVANRYLDDTTGGTHFIIFTNVCIIAQDRTTDRLFLEVKGHAKQSCAGKLYQF